MLPSSNNKTENWLTTRILQRNFAGKEPSATASSFYHKITKTCPNQLTGSRTISTPHGSSTPTYRVPWIARLHGPEPSRHCWWHTTFFFVIIQPSLANSKINFIFPKRQKSKTDSQCKYLQIFFICKEKKSSSSWASRSEKIQRKISHVMNDLGHIGSIISNAWRK